MSPQLRLIHIPMLAATCLVVAALAVAASSAAPTHSCKYPPYFVVGKSQGYFRELRVTNVSCAFGRKLIHAYVKCRNPSGKTPRGTCKKRVLGMRCREGKRVFSDDGAGGFADFSVRVTCRRGDKRVIHVYQQDL
jgi:hypothetical protein